MECNASRYAQSGLGEEALKLWCQMQRIDTEINNVTFVDILSACAILETLEQVKQVHDRVIRSGFESDAFVGSYLLDMHAKCGSIENSH